jgi:hypothetical protein
MKPLVLEMGFSFFFKFWVYTTDSDPQILLPALFLISHGATKFQRDVLQTLAEYSDQVLHIPLQTGSRHA